MKIKNNGGKLSDKEIRELQSLYKQREEIAVKALTNGEKEQNVFWLEYQLIVKSHQSQKLLKSSKRRIKHVMMRKRCKETL